MISFCWFYKLHNTIPLRLYVTPINCTNWKNVLVTDPVSFKTISFIDLFWRKNYKERKSHVKVLLESRLLRIVQGNNSHGSFKVIRAFLHANLASIVRPDTSRRQRRRLPPCPLVIALVPLKCCSRYLQCPHIGCPLPRRICIGALALSRTIHAR